MTFRPFRLMAVILVLGVSAPLVLAAPGRARILNANPNGPSRYIVALNGDVADAEASTNDLVQWNGGKLNQYHRFLRAFTVEMPEIDALRLAEDPRVRYVEQDSVIRATTTQTSAPWGLDRIDQRDRPGDANYNYNVTGAGVTAYIVDSGINTTHTDFGGRASVGIDTVGDGHNGIDCNGHGTHVAGTVGGTTYGVAKGVSLVAVRVLACDGTGTVSNFVAGINWAIGNHTTGPAVMNISLGADSPSQSFDDAVTAAVADGIVVAVAAGNGTANNGVAVDSCGTSPGRTPNAITVSATDSFDVRASFANFGPCVDLFAPGVSVLSDWYSSNSATATLSGTSMATPHVTGAAALYLQVVPSSTPATVAAGLVSSASVNKLTSIGTGSPNRLLYMADLGSTNSCATNGVVTTPGTAALTLRPAGAPAVGNLPANGVWQKTQRRDGETWTYTFNIDPASAAKASRQTVASAPPDTSTISAPLQAAASPNDGAAITGRHEKTATNGLPFTGDLLQPRVVTSADTPRTLKLREVATAASSIDGTTTAAFGSLPHVARLVSPISLAAAGSDGRGLTAVDALFRNVKAGDDASSVRLFLKFRHPDADHVTAWLTAGDRDLLLWDGSSEAAAAGDSIVIDRVLSKELAGRSLNDRWTIYLSDSGSGRVGVLEQAWISVTTLPHVAADAVRGTGEAGDVIARRAYMMTGASLGGSTVDTPGIGRPVYLYADFRLPGTVAATVTHRALIDGAVFCSGSSLQAPGDYYVFCNRTWTPDAGSHTLQWDFDYPGAPGNANAGSNSVSKTFTPNVTTDDIVAERAYMMTGAGLSGAEVNPPSVGQVVYLYGDFGLTLAAPATITQRAYMDANLWCSGSTLQGSGEYYVFCNSAWTATAGMHTLHWDFDYNNTVPETNENNNSASTSFTSSSAAVDIINQRSYLRTAPALGGVEVSQPTVGQAVYLYADYQVVGAGSPITISQRAILDGNVVCAGPANWAAGFFYVDCTAPWSVTPGSHTLQWDLDYDNAVLETNETNNSSSFTFTPLGGSRDIVAVRAYMRTGSSGGGVEIDPPVPGQTVYFHGDWQMTGTGASQTVTERAVLDNNVFCSCSSIGSPGGVYISSCTQGWVATPGVHTLRWDYDYGSTVTETNETNNSASKITTVVARRGDFNGDGNSDIYWRSYATGAIAVWQMNGMAFSSIVNLPGLPNTAYRIEGIGDFNGDGQPDILWRNGTTGANALWLMNGATVASIVDLPGLPGANFHFEGVADMDGDGKPDILIRNYANGNNAVWLMNGTTFSAIVNLPALPNPDYHIEAAADFDGDGKADIVWRNYTTGANALWLMNGTNYVSTVNLDALPNSSYHIDAVADFNKDGHNDIVWRSYATGANALWVMDSSYHYTIVNLDALPDTNYELSGPR